MVIYNYIQCIEKKQHFISIYSKMRRIFPHAQGRNKTPPLTHSQPEGCCWFFLKLNNLNFP